MIYQYDEEVEKLSRRKAPQEPDPDSYDYDDILGDVEARPGFGARPKKRRAAKPRTKKMLISSRKHKDDKTGRVADQGGRISRPFRDLDDTSAQSEVSVGRSIEQQSAAEEVVEIASFETEPGTRDLTLQTSPASDYMESNAVIERLTDEDDEKELEEGAPAGEISSVTSPVGYTKEKEYKRKRVWMRTAVAGIAIGSAIGLGGYIIVHHAGHETPRTGYGVELDLSEEELAKFSSIEDVDEAILDTYEFLLSGVYDSQEYGSERHFEFDGEGGYFGYTSAEPDDFGLYSLESKGPYVYLTISTSRATDRYLLEIADDGLTIRLTNQQDETVTLISV